MFSERSQNNPEILTNFLAANNLIQTQISHHCFPTISKHLFLSLFFCFIAEEDDVKQLNLNDLVAIFLIFISNS